MAALSACASPSKPRADTNPDTVANTGADADTDTDTDADSDADTAAPTILDEDGDGSPAADDCDDADPAVFPGAPELCDGHPNDCGTASEDGLVTVDGSKTFGSLQNALGAASAGSEVRVCPGRYVGGFAASVRIDLVAQGGSAVTILDGDTSYRTLAVAPGSSITGFTITGGNRGGLVLSPGGALTVSQCLITANTSYTSAGAGVFLDAGSTAVISDTTIEANIAYEDDGGGIYLGTGSTLDLTGTLVSINEVSPPHGGGHGGGLVMYDSAVTGGVFSGNLVPRGYGVYNFGGSGGGIATNGVCSLTGTEVVANDGSYGGGLDASGDLTLTDVWVHDNTGDSGAGFFAGYATVSLLGATVIEDNASAHVGGGADLFASTLSGGLFQGNSAAEDGGGLRISASVVSDVAVTANTASEGGGLSLYDSVGPSKLANVMVSANVATGDGGGIRWAIGGGASSSFDGGSIVGNVAAGNGGGLALSDATNALGGPTGDLTLTATEITDNQASTGGAAYTDPVAENSVTLTLQDSTVARNAATAAGGVALPVAGTELVSLDSDWGTAADDNLPDDVVAGGNPYAGYALASFACDVAGCSPTP
jgi:hypothetical protein